MGSLAGCLRLHKISGAEADYIRKLAGEYKAEGFTPQERNERAVKDYLKMQLDTHADIVRQIKEHIGKGTPALNPAIPPGGTKAAEQPLRKGIEPKHIEQAQQEYSGYAQLEQMMKDNNVLWSDIERSMNKKLDINNPTDQAIAHEYLNKTLEQAQAAGKARATEAEEKARQQTIEPKSKEPWEMTFREYQKATDEGYRENGVIPYHKNKVLQAISEGKTIPADVLKDYPDLQAKAERGYTNAVKVTKPYFTLSKAHEAIRVNPKTLTDEKLQKHIVKLRDYERYTKNVDVYGKELLEGGYFVGATTQASTGITPKDSMLSTNLGQALDIAIAEKNKRAAVPTQEIQDFGEKIGGARKDTAERGDVYLGSLLGSLQQYIDNGTIQKGYNDLLNLGKHIYQQGHDTGAKFFRAMRDGLGKMWNSYKKMAVKVWADVQKWNKGLGERGAVSNPFAGEPELSAQGQAALDYLQNKGIKTATDEQFKKAGVSKEDMAIIRERLQGPQQERPQAKEEPMSKAATELKNNMRPSEFLNDKTVRSHIINTLKRVNPQEYAKMVANGDMKLLDSTYSLPYWLAKKHKEWKAALNIQENREEKRSELKHNLFQMSEAYMQLKDKAELAQVEKALIDGNIGHKVFDEQELKARGLSDAGIAAYKSVRTTLDTIHERWLDRAEANILDTYKGEKWFGMLELIYGKELNLDETAHLTSYLNRIKATEKAPVEYVRDLMKTVFTLKTLSAEDNKKLAQSFSKFLKEHGRKLTKEESKALKQDFRESYKELSKDLTPEQKIQAAQRLRRFEERLKAQLPLEEKMKLSKAFAGYYSLASKQVSELKNIIRALNPELSEEQGNEAVRGLVAAYSSVALEMKELKHLRSEMGKQVGYFPEHHGEGKYYVSVKDSNGDSVYFRKVKDRFEVKQLLDAVKSYPAWEGFKFNSGELTKELESTYTGLSDINTNRVINNAIQQMRATGDISEWAVSDIRKSLLTTISDELKTRGFAVHALKRNPKLILGFQETDLKGVLGDYITGYAGIETKQDAAMEFFELLGSIDKNKPRLFSELTHYAESMLRNEEKIDRIIGKAKAIAFTYFLTGNLKSAAVQFTQNFITGIPILAARVGGKSLKAEMIYSKAMKDVTMGNITAIEQKMLDEMLDKGIAEDQYIQQIMSATKGAFSKTVTKAMEALALPFSHMEKFNRKSAALAMFRVEMEANTKKGMSEAEAYADAFDKAKEFVYDTHYLMTKANDPRWARGGDMASQGAKLLYTFRKFNHNYILSMKHYARNEQGKLNLAVMGRSLAYMSLLGGAAGLPFLDDLLDELEKLTGIPFRTKMRNTLKGAGGEILEKFGMAGLPALIGVDISGSLKIGLPGVGGASESIYGVYSGLYQKGVKAINAAELGEYGRAIETAAPVFIENPMKAYRTATEGARTPEGKILFDAQGKPIKLTTGEAIGQAMGFRPERTAAMSGEDRTYRNIAEHYKDKHDELITKFRLADTKAEKEDVIRAIRKYNENAAEYGQTLIKNESLRRALTQRPDKKRMRYRMLQGQEDEE